MSTMPSLTTMQETLRRSSVCHDQCLFASWAVRTSGRQTMAPSRRAWLARLVCDGTLSWEDSGMVQAFYAGDTTGLQRSHCPCQLDEAQLLWSARSDIVQAGKAPAAVIELKQRLTKTGTPFPESGKVLADTYAATTFFIDATTRCLHPTWAARFRGAVEALSPGAGTVATGSAGFEAFDVGLVEIAEACAMELLARVVDRGVTRLVVDAPGALFMLRRLRPDGLELLHTSEFIAQAFDKYPDAGLETVTVTVQDSALLARYCDLIEAPRRALDRLPGVQYIEMPTSGVLANPTGGRLWPADSFDFNMMAESRISEARTTSASTIITLGPYARRNLTAAAERHGIRVLDFVEFILERSNQ